MARFHYSMQSILDIKEKLETQAKQEFSAASAALREEEEKLVALQERKAEYEAQAKKLRTGTLNILEMEEAQTAIITMDSFIEHQKIEIKRAEDALEVKRQKLTEAMMERKTHEKLRERAFEEFLAEEKRVEGKEVDELTSYTYGERIRAKA